MRKGLPVLDRVADLLNLMTDPNHDLLLSTDPDREYVKTQYDCMNLLYLTYDGIIHAYKNTIFEDRFVTFFRMFGIKYTEHDYTYTFDTAYIGEDHNIFKKDAETLIKLRKS